LDERAREAARRFPLRFPRDYLESVADGGPDDLVRAIGWPHPEEVGADPGGLEDPVGEKPLATHPLVLRKYPDRAILLTTSRCHFYCRFCFRAGHRQDPTIAEVREALATLRNDPELFEIILSGGDPLVLTDAFLGEILAELRGLPQLGAIRIHTRAPVHEPSRVTAELVDTLVQASPHAPRVAVHVTHPRELTTAFDRALSLMREGGLPLRSQTVLLRGVNDEVETLAALFKGLYARRVEPYYLHHPDRVPGTQRFRMGIEEGRAIARALRARLPGPAMPAYVLDLPDGRGKVPVDWLERESPERWRVTRADGSVSFYDER
jgi:lysine 2,3-aminomutase